MSAFRKVGRRSVVRPPEFIDGAIDSDPFRAGADPNSDAGRHGDNERERQNGLIDRDLRGAWREPFDEHDQQRNPPPGQTKPHEAARERQERAFGQELSQKPQTAGAERAANRDLALAPDHASQHQVRDARTHNQEHEAGGAKEHQECGLERSRQLVAKRHGADPKTTCLGILRRVLALHPFGDEVQIGAGLRQRDVVANPGECRHHACRA